MKINIGFAIPTNITDAASAQAGLVRKDRAFVVRFQLMGVCNLLVGAILKAFPGDASARPNQLRSCAKAFGGNADANRRESLSFAASALDDVSRVISSKEADAKSVETATAVCCSAFDMLVRAFELTDDAGNLLEISKMPEPERRERSSDHNSDEDAPFNAPVVKRGKKRD